MPGAVSGRCAGRVPREGVLPRSHLGAGRVEKAPEGDWDVALEGNGEEIGLPEVNQHPSCAVTQGWWKQGLRGPVALGEGPSSISLGYWKTPPQYLLQY